jgi:hypothetical protein
MNVIILVTTALYVMLLPGLLTGQSSPLPVCKVLHDLQKYANRDIEIRGEWIHTDHGMFIRGKCARALSTGDHRWSSAVWLQLPWLETDEPVDFTADRSALEKAQNEAGELTESSRGRAIYATFAGKLQVRQRLEIGRRQYGVALGNGFGHLNAYPAQLIVRSIYKISLRQ